MTVMGFYWRSPRRDPQLDVELVIGIHEILASTSIHLFDWWEARDTNTTEKHIAFDETTILKYLLRGQNRTDFDKTPIPKLGYRFSGWSPDKIASGFSYRLNGEPNWFEPNYSELNFLTNIDQGILPFTEENA